MKYEVCFMNSMLITVIALYRTEQDYLKDKPQIIYVITRRRDLKEALQKMELIKKKYKDSKVELVIDKRGKDLVSPILEICYNSKKIVSPSLW